MSAGSDVARLHALNVEKIRDGLWRWTAPHPDWEPGEEWDRDVGCLYYEGPGAVVLIDPLVPADDAGRFWEALDRDVERAGPPVVALRTVHWHQRSIGDVVNRYPDARAWTGDADDTLPAGVDAHRIARADETLFWIEEHRALVAGDVLLGTEDNGVRVCPDSWLSKQFRGPEFRDSLRFLLDLPIELLLVSHGRPVLANGRAALAVALDA
jgi:glyoxylase-like metal-dependent hydrolase (beta-lactamase superfamily II)